MLMPPSTAALATDATTALRETFGFDAFRPGQDHVVEALLRKEHVLAVMPTGAGKSLCFQLPATMREGFAVVVSPLIALMENQVRHLQAAGISAGMIHSGRERHLNVADWRAATAGDLKLLYMSPERLMTGRMLSALKRQKVSYFVIDEAHCIAQWGHNFREEYLALGDLTTHFPDIPIAAFTATADTETQADIKSRLFGGEGLSFVHGFDRPNLALQVIEKHRGDKQLLSLLRVRKGGAGIIYCRSRKRAEETALLLEGRGHSAIPFHAGLDDEVKGRALHRFLTEPGIIVCATVAFGMGIDKADVRFVIHRDLPASVEAYYQEIGRAGRDGAPADAILLYGYGDLVVRRKMIDGSESPAAVKRAERRRLDALVSFCEATVCRRNMLLGHFGEYRREPCGKCDLCTSGAR